MDSETSNEFICVYKKMVDLQELNARLMKCVNDLTDTVKELKQTLDTHLIHDHEVPKEE